MKPVSEMSVEEIQAEIAATETVLDELNKRRDEHFERCRDLERQLAEMTGFVLSANRQDEEPRRLERLRKVSVALFDLDFRPGLILALHDHKGTLHVNWARQPSVRLLAEVAKAWNDAGELYSNHYIKGQPWLIDVDGANPFERLEA
jgi:hypothetical protein